MAIVVKCVITINEERYEGDSIDLPNIVHSFGNSSTTGTFSHFPKEFLLDMVSSSVERAVKDTTNKLNVIKGE